MSIDLAQLPTPEFIKQLSFDEILSELKTDMISRNPELSQLKSLLENDSELIIKMLTEWAYREVYLRAQFNNSAKQTMLAFAAGNNLDIKAVDYNLTRLIITPADDSVQPPTTAIYETDNDFRIRILASFDGYTTAGTINSYKYHAKSASPLIKDIAILSNTPGVVEIIVLSTLSGGSADNNLLSQVKNQCNAEEIRPLTDIVKTQSATIIKYQINAQLFFEPNTNTEAIKTMLLATATRFTDSNHKIGKSIDKSALYALLSVPGIAKVELNDAIKNGIKIKANQAPFCTAINLTEVTNV